MRKYITYLAVRWLTNELRNDEGLYLAYRSNIAVCIQDNYKRYSNKTIESCLHEFSNVCADDFLKIWIKD